MPQSEPRIQKNARYRNEVSIPTKHNSIIIEYIAKNSYGIRLSNLICWFDMKNKCRAFIESKQFAKLKQSISDVLDNIEAPATKAKN